MGAGAVVVTFPLAGIVVNPRRHLASIVTVRNPARQRRMIGRECRATLIVLQVVAQAQSNRLDDHLVARLSHLHLLVHLLGLGLVQEETTAIMVLPMGPDFAGFAQNRSGLMYHRQCLACLLVYLQLGRRWVAILRLLIARTRGRRRLADGHEEDILRFQAWPLRVECTRKGGSRGSN